MKIGKIGIIGAGTMGSGIAQNVATHGFQVGMFDISEQALQKACSSTNRNLTKLVQKGQLREAQLREIMDRITPTAQMERAAENADIVIEAAPEDLQFKKKLFKDLDQCCSAQTILASNTSGLSITAIASATLRPDKVVGMHWFNPPPVMKLIEIIRGQLTSEDTINTMKELSQHLGKIPVVCKDSQGFIVSRVLAIHFIEALRIYEEGLASKEDIDVAIKLGLNYPMGPFELLDLVGMDIPLKVCSDLADAFGDRFRPNQIFHKMVESGQLGRKTGRGFYQY